MWQLSRLVGFTAVLMGLLAFTSSEVRGQKNKNPGPKDSGNSATPADYAMIKNAKELVGTIVSIEGASKTLTIRVPTSYYAPNEKYKPPQLPKQTVATGGANNPAALYAKFQHDQYQLYLDIQRQEQLIAHARTPQERQRAVGKLQQDMAKYQQQQQQFMARMSAASAKAVVPAQNVNRNMDPNNQPFKMVTTTKDYSLEIQEEAGVRKLFLSLEYDDTGNVKQYSDKEKDELRGKDKTKPGYVAKFEDVAPGQEVKLFLTPPPQAKAKAKEKAKEKAKDADTKDDAKADAKAEPKDKDAKAAKDAKADEDPPVMPMADPTRPTVNLIVMTRDQGLAAIEPAGQAAKKGNKKK